jgi:hypothetical protein
MWHMGARGWYGVSGDFMGPMRVLYIPCTHALHGYPFLTLVPMRHMGTLFLMRCIMSYPMGGGRDNKTSTYSALPVTFGWGRGVFEL